MSSMRMYALIFLTFFFSGLTQLAYGEATASSSRMIDGRTIDQGIAYVLMLVALFITYFVH
ncbi:hypothetical protein J5N97_013322 [Dioscorea zingiberensis]|uniref:Arabinogalactan peptide 22 n=1 Tax=Dioscorea zingiberensis TaxID=325984 RepID=A0A9D5CR09_9LILI|nr:hypothetical protein J5N97_013322 [Dioscorea zingiberensis]